MKPNASKIIAICTGFFVFFLTTISVQAAPGDLDPSFGSGGKVTSLNFFGHAMAIQTDGTIAPMLRSIKQFKHRDWSVCDKSFQHFVNCIDLDLSGDVPSNQVR